MTHTYQFHVGNPLTRRVVTVKAINLYAAIDAVELGGAPIQDVRHDLTTCETCNQVPRGGR